MSPYRISTWPCLRSSSLRSTSAALFLSTIEGMVLSGSWHTTVRRL